jgi:hypothetical protein
MAHLRQKDYGPVQMRSRAFAAHAASGSYVFRSSARLWQQLFAFAFGFCIQFNVLVGGAGDGVTGVGSYGYRLSDILAICTLGLLAIFAIAPYRFLSLGLFVLIIAIIFASPMLSPDSRTRILAIHYVLYSFAAIYLVVILSKAPAIDRFCWGLVVGVLATVPIFVLQAMGYASTLLEWGLVPGYAETYDVADVIRYSGLWAHPNEAAHVAAISAAAGAYFSFVHRRFLPSALVAFSLLAVFYFTAGRAGLVVGYAVLLIPILLSRRIPYMWRAVIIMAALATMAVFATNMNFVTYRFGNDQNMVSNIHDRLVSTIYGLQYIFSHPLGSSIADISSSVNLATGGIGSVHDGFLFFGAVFGLLPLVILLVSFVTNFYVRSDADIFFALLTFQVIFSFLFEILPASYSYVSIMCIIMAWAFLKTPIGAMLKYSAARRPRMRRHSMTSRSRLSSAPN